eukprot:TRINITY_DN2409_c0_g1_i1.p1 TRINITY_DN2409_c0_g1~~TRINITY_DN2409_c0_g1_i1.p1  ORF type:complete len:308 (-),score=46.14 TRINITY_DN2409_c0_g1_i1:188-1111(-)
MQAGKQQSWKSICQISACLFNANIQPTGLFVKSYLQDVVVGSIQLQQCRFQRKFPSAETSSLLGPVGDTYEEIFTGNYAKERELVTCKLTHVTKEQEVLLIGLPCYGYPWTQQKIASVMEEIQPQSVVADIDRKTMTDMKDKDDKGRVNEDTVRFQFGYGLLPSAVAMFEGMVEGAKYGANWVFVDRDVIYKGFGLFYRGLFNVSLLTGLLMPKEVQKILFVRPEYPEQPVVMLEEYENKEILEKYFRRVAPNVPNGLVDLRSQYVMDELENIEDSKVVGLVGEVHVKVIQKLWAEKMKQLMEQIEK